MLETPALWVACATMAPLMLFTAWYDIKYLKIPNWVVLTVLGIYVITGLWGLSWQGMLWGLGAGAITLFVFFLVYTAMSSAGLIGLGAGDIKLMSVLVPFIDAKDALHVLLVFTITSLVLAVAFLIIWGFRKKRTRYASMNQAERRMLKVVSPYGVAMAGTILYYLGMQVYPTLA